MERYKPANIIANRKSSQFVIEWDDGHSSIYPFSLLRWACPCVDCRGGHEYMGEIPELDEFSLPEEETPAHRIRKVEAVGTYAITIEWEDGHSFGIYNWDFLRALCPCPVCVG